MTEPTASPPAPDLQTLGRYVIRAELGRGGFATVYRALDPNLDREVALKVLHPQLLVDRSFVARFRKEARALANLRHAHIVTVYEVSEADGRLFIAMELAQGPSLADAITQRGRIPWAETLDILRPVCTALDYAHSQGIVHRDLKPANILLDKERGPLLTDFGLARIMGGSSMSVSISGGIVGTPAYIAPEVWEEEAARPAADIYALGCVCYEMVTGALLFNGATPMHIMRAHDKGPQFTAWPEGTPPGLDAALRIALAAAPGARYPSSEAFWHALNDAEANAQAAREQAERKAVAAQWQAEVEQAIAEGEWGVAKKAVGRWLKLTPESEAAQAARRKIEMQETREQEAREEEARRKRQEEEEVARKAREAQEREAARVAAEEEARRKRQEEEESARKAREAQEREAARLAVEEEARRKQQEEEEAAREAQEREAARVATAEQAQRQAQAEALRKRWEETAAKETARQTESQKAAKRKRPVGKLIAGVLGGIGALIAIFLLGPHLLALFIKPPDPINTYTREKDGMAMVYVPAGEFQMGNTKYSNEQPVHTVALDAFWIDRTEVTNAQYQKCVDARACTASEYKDNSTFNSEAQPVVGVDWNAAKAYCAWAGGQLPTEAQWEYAARGAKGFTYPWGNQPPTCDLANRYNCVGRTTPVGSYPKGASWVGALDMAGNVWEWTADWYGLYASGQQTNPTGPSSGEYRVVRGGSWGNFAPPAHGVPSLVLAFVRERLPGVSVCRCARPGLKIIVLCPLILCLLLSKAGAW